jgi:hypothetical protein
VAPAEDEPIVAERGDVVGEDLASLVEPLLEVERRRAEGRRRVGLRPGDLGRHPERAVHAVAGDEVARVVHDGDGDLEVLLSDDGVEEAVGSLARGNRVDTSVLPMKTG